MRSVIVIMLLLLSKLGASAQAPAGIAYYDVDRLYDTIPSLFYDDRAYTPEGTYGWNTERYRRKIRQVAETVDSMALPVVALYGVETEQVARDIAARCIEDYACLHRTLSSRNGLDFALLYWGDRLFIRSVESGFDYLAVDGTLDGRPLLLVLSRYSSTAEHIAAKRAKADEQYRIVIMGRYISRRNGQGRSRGQRQCVVPQRMDHGRPDTGNAQRDGRCRSICPPPAARFRGAACGDILAQALYGRVFEPSAYIHIPALSICLRTLPTPCRPAP